MASSIDPPRPPLAPAVRVLAEAALQRQNWLLSPSAAPAAAGAASPVEALSHPVLPAASTLPPSPQLPLPVDGERVSLSAQAREGLQTASSGSMALAKGPVAQRAQPQAAPGAGGAREMAGDGASPRAVALPTQWPAQDVGAPLLRLLNTLVQQASTPGGPAPRVLVAQPWPDGMESAPGAAALPALQTWRVAQGTVYTPEGARGVTLTLRLPLAGMPAQAPAPVAPAGLSVGFAGPLQALAPGLFALVLQGLGAAGQRTSALLSLELAPAPGAAAVVYGRDLLQARADPWLALAALQASGQWRTEEDAAHRAGEPPCSTAGCPYEGRAPCVQPFCLALRVQPAAPAAPVGPA